MPVGYLGKYVNSFQVGLLIFPPILQLSTHLPILWIFDIFCAEPAARSDLASELTKAFDNRVGHYML